MKKTSIIMLALAITGLVIIESLVMYGVHYMKPYSELIINTDNVMTNIKLQPFSNVSFNSEESIGIYHAGDGRIIICQTDSISEPQLQIPENIKQFIQTDYSNGFLNISIREDNPEQDKGFHQTLIYAMTPITLFLPQMPDTIYNNLYLKLMISGKAPRKLTLSTTESLSFINAELDSLTILGDNRIAYRNKDRYKTEFENSYVDYFELSESKKPLNISSDTISQVNKMKISGVPNYDLNFIPGNLRINNFIFCPKGQKSGILLTDYSTLTTSFNTNQN